MGRKEMPSLTHHPLLPTAGERTGLWFMIVEELFLPLTGCSTWKSGPYSLLGQPVELSLVMLMLARKPK